MKLSIIQLDAIRGNALRSGDYDLATLAEDAKVSPSARALVQGQHVPCAKCEDPVRHPELVKAQDAAIAALPGDGPARPKLTPIAHTDCAHPEQGTVGVAGGHTPSSLVLML